MKNKISNSTRKKVYERDGWRCALCDSTRGIQIHHYIPRGMGGFDDEQNLITLCATCHAQAHGNCLEPGGWTEEDMEQAIVEYLADYYAPCWMPEPVPQWLKEIAKELYDEDLKPP